MAPSSDPASDLNCSMPSKAPVVVRKAAEDPNLYHHFALENGLECIVVQTPAGNISATASAAMADESAAEYKASSSSSSSSSPSSSSASPSEAGSKVAGVSLSVKTGYFADPAAVPGLAHFLEHMLFMGSAQFPGENEWEDYLARNGGYSNASTDAEHTNYIFEVQPRALLQALAMFSGFFVAPLFNKSAMKREVRAVESEFVEVLTNDATRLQDLIIATCHPAHPGHKFGWGNLETLEKAPQRGGSLDAGSADAGAVDAGTASGGAGAASAAVGAKGSLGGTGERLDVREVMRAFHGRNYSAVGMRMVVVVDGTAESPRAVDIEKAVRESYEAIRNVVSPADLADIASSATSAGTVAVAGAAAASPVSTAASTAGVPAALTGYAAAGDPFAGCCEGQVFRNIPVRDEDTLTVTWSLPPTYSPSGRTSEAEMSAYLRCKPFDYLEQVLGHEGRGSLLSALKRRGLGTAVYVSAGPEEPSRNTAYTLLSVAVTLTPKGLARHDDVVALVVQAARMLATADDDEQRRFWSETAAMNEISFRFAQQQDAIEMAESIAAAMQVFPASLAVAGPSLMFQYDGDLLRAVTAMMTPERCRVDIGSRSFSAALEALPRAPAGYAGAEAGAAVKAQSTGKPTGKAAAPRLAAKDKLTGKLTGKSGTGKAGTGKASPSAGASYTGGVAFETEFFHVIYSRENISPALLEGWAKQPIASDLHFPEPNHFIPKDFGLVTARPHASSVHRCSHDHSRASASPPAGAAAAASSAMSDTAAAPPTAVGSDLPPHLACLPNAALIEQPTLVRGAPFFLQQAAVASAGKAEAAGPAVALKRHPLHDDVAAFPVDAALSSHNSNVAPPHASLNASHIVPYDSAWPVLKDALWAPSAHGELWYLPDPVFKLPRGSVSMLLASKEFYTSAEATVLGRLFVNLFVDAMEEYVYPAQLAELSFSCELMRAGIEITISGFSDRLLPALDGYLRGLRTFVDRLDAEVTASEAAGAAAGASEGTSDSSMTTSEEKSARATTSPSVLGRWADVAHKTVIAMRHLAFDSPDLAAHMRSLMLQRVRFPVADLVDVANRLEPASSSEPSTPDDRKGKSNSNAASGTAAGASKSKAHMGAAAGKTKLAGARSPAASPASPAPRITPRTLLDIVKRFFSQGYLYCLVHGNLTPEAAIAAYDNAVAVLGVAPALGLGGVGPSRLFQEDIIALPRVPTYLSVPSRNPAEQASTVSLTLQLGPFSAALVAMSGLLYQLMAEPLFDTLRTREQLGYSVSMDELVYHGVISLVFDVTSSSYPVTHIAKRLQEFLREFREKKLANMSNDEFNNAKRTYSNNLQVPDSALHEINGRVWNEVRDGTRLFARWHRSLTALSHITLPQVIAVYDSLLLGVPPSFACVPRQALAVAAGLDAPPAVVVLGAGSNAQPVVATEQEVGALAESAVCAQVGAHADKRQRKLPVAETSIATAMAARLAGALVNHSPSSGYARRELLVVVCGQRAVTGKAKGAGDEEDADGSGAASGEEDEDEDHEEDEDEDWEAHSASGSVDGERHTGKGEEKSGDPAFTLDTAAADAAEAARARSSVTTDLQSRGWAALDTIKRACASCSLY